MAASRLLAAPPPSFLARETGAPALGTYAGPLPPIDLRAGPFARLARRKRWVYLAASAGDVWLSVAVVRTGYAATAFAFLYHHGRGAAGAGAAMLAEASSTGPALLAEVADDPHAAGVFATYTLGRSTVRLVRAGSAVEVTVRLGSLSVDARVEERASDDRALSAIVPLGPGLVTATEKRAPLEIAGTARAAGEAFSLDGGVAGYDYSHGLMPRRTAWRWAFALGRADDGSTFAVNLTQGFCGAAECAAFVDGALYPLGEPRFTFDRQRPSEPWRIEGDGVDLAFRPGAVYARRENLLVVRSRFLQPVGTFTGTIRPDGEALRVRDLPGVVEDQDVYW